MHDKTSENIIWLKLSKGAVSITKETYIAGVYNSPKNSTYTRKNDFNALDILRQRLTKFRSSDLIFLVGDFNRRVRSEPDFITENGNDLHLLDIVNSSRNNQDLSVNEYGRQLIGLCFKTGNLKWENKRGFSRAPNLHWVSCLHYCGLSLPSEATLLDPFIIQYLSILELNIL